MFLALPTSSRHIPAGLPHDGCSMPCSRKGTGRVLALGA